MRMKSISRSLISGRYSCWVLNSSPIAMRNAGLLPQQAEVIVLLRRERILEEEQPVRLERLAQVDALIERDALVHVVQQLDFVTELGAEVLEELRQHPAVRRRLPDRARVGRSDRFAGRSGGVAGRAACAVTGIARGADLDPDVAEAALHRRAGVLLDFLEAGAAGVEVTVGAVAHLAAEQLVERQAGALTLDVPQRDVDAAHRIEQDRAVAPVRAHVARLPDVLDLVDVAADQERLAGTR